MNRAVAFACAFALGAMSGHAPQLSLNVRSGGRILWSGPIRAGEPFDIAFQHSSEHCRWTQHYIAGSDATLRQVSSTFPCYGAGMPVAPPNGSALLVTPDGYTVAAPLVIGELHMMAWRRANLKLQYRNEMVPLGAMLRDFQEFTITVDP